MPTASRNPAAARLTPAELVWLAEALDPMLFMQRAGYPAVDPWQAELLRDRSPRVLLLAARQLGKSSVTALAGLHRAVFHPESLVLLFAPSLRQSGELFRKLVDAYEATDRPVAATQQTATTLALANGSRVCCLPGNAATVRGFSNPALVIIDEAALCDDDLLTAVLPMLRGGGALTLISTPMGRRGFFHACWEDTGGPWRRFRVTARECPRVSAAYLAEQRRILGDRNYRQEHECSFDVAIDQVFTPEFVAGLFTSTKRPLELADDDDPPAGAGLVGISPQRPFLIGA